ncbi:hypothetical protein F2Q69_00019788 [Brassica cretica]|uniref:Uncharacterized protein n=1 Tax=Brassica cretica TaxID=69181 RepID=A0A8S9PZJ1_BRACR|nr:hypothetical protein F2Q69_00019788 [Brassica cretica]
MPKRLFNFFGAPGAVREPTKLPQCSPPPHLYDVPVLPPFAPSAAPESAVAVPASLPRSSRFPLSAYSKVLHRALLSDRVKGGCEVCHQGRQPFVTASLAPKRSFLSPVESSAFMEYIYFFMLHFPLSIAPTVSYYVALMSLPYLLCCVAGWSLIILSALDRILFYWRPPPVVPRSKIQQPPLKLLGAILVSVRWNIF